MLELGDICEVLDLSKAEMKTVTGWEKGFFSMYARPVHVQIRTLPNNNEITFHLAMYWDKTNQTRHIAEGKTNVTNLKKIRSALAEELDPKNW